MSRDTDQLTILLYLSYALVYLYSLSYYIISIDLSIKSFSYNIVAGLKSGVVR